MFKILMFSVYFLLCINIWLNLNRGSNVEKLCYSFLRHIIRLSHTRMNPYWLKHVVGQGRWVMNGNDVILCRCSNTTRSHNISNGYILFIAITNLNKYIPRCLFSPHLQLLVTFDIIYFFWPLTSIYCRLLRDSYEL